MQSATRYREKDNTFSSVKRTNNKRRVQKKRAMRIDYKKLALFVIATVVAFVAVYVVYSHLPFVKVNKAIAAGNRYSEKAEYDAAISSYSEAIEIDSGSVAAYSNMASAYLSIDDSESAKKVLYDGWQNTESQALLSNYLTVIMNDAVNSINKGEGNIDTVLSVVSVLEQDGTNSDAIELLDAAYTRCFSVYNDDVNALFRSGDSGTNLAKYDQIVSTLTTVYSLTPSEDLKNLILKYAVPASDSFTMNYEDAVTYLKILENVENLVGTNDEISSLKACITNAQEVYGIFWDIFAQLDVGNVDELRDFVVSDEYVNLRNIFLNNEETPQENTTYVSICRDAIILNRNDGNFSYRFLNFEENPENSGVITLWANYFEDDGVQRNSISYEPPAINGNPYPHTKYTVTYLKSYTNSGSNTKVAKMNYRLSTSITDESGKTTETIVGDWGGTDEYEMDIKTIESRIRA
ncbi:tetratricopeptide repeat protein [Butyrivibrio sp. VCB2006]|uniref:tetratricopeptide repeat protein n=1 Tax=Butyrivibrio sp. VCB2006 TaxID=1280679 RepID=UPI00040165C3|nr:tetratricopeptide repeat protein [Butyrivibrio sp. VCB2006]